jgi:hypothetical protein
LAPIADRALYFRPSPQNSNLDTLRPSQTNRSQLDAQALRQAGAITLDLAGGHAAGSTDGKVNPSTAAAAAAAEIPSAVLMRQSLAKYIWDPEFSGQSALVQLHTLPLTGTNSCGVATLATMRTVAGLRCARAALERRVANIPWDGRPWCVPVAKVCEQGVRGTFAITAATAWAEASTDVFAERYARLVETSHCSSTSCPIF